MVLPVPDYALNDPGNYSGSGTVAHAHRSFTLGGAGYDLSAAPDGTLVIIWASLGHEHNDIDLEPGEVVGKVYTGNVTEYTGDPTTLTEVTGWSTTAWNVSVPSSVIIVHGWAFYATLGDGTGGTINKALFTETDGSGNSELCIEYSGGVTYPQTDSWVTPIVRIYEPNAGNNAVVDVADIQNSEGTGDPSTLNIASFTTGQDDTHLELLTESIAGTWDNNDPTPGSWDDDGSGDGGYSQGWSLDVATAGTVAAQSVTNQNSGQPDGHVGVLIPVYYEAGGDATASPAVVTATVDVPTPEVDDGVTDDVKLQTGPVDITTDGQTVTLPTAVASLDNAFVFIAGNRHQGAGPVGSASTQHADDMGVVAELTAVDTITFGYDGGNGTRVQWVVMEYVGAPGGDNEFIVRGRHNFTYTSDTNQTTALATAPTNVNKVIPFIRGISSTHASAGSNNLGARAWLNNTGNTLNVACSQEDDTTTVGVTAVEFTGSNWSVGHMAWNGATSDGPIDRPLVQEADGDPGGTSFDVGDWATAAIMSWGHASDDANEAIADGWPLWEPTPASTTQVRWTFDANHDGADDDYVVHVLQHDDLAVTRYSDTSSAADETTIDVTSAGLTDLARSLVLGTSITSGSGTAYGRGWRLYYLNSLTEAAHWSHRSGNTMAHRLEVIDFAAVTTSSGTSATAAPDAVGAVVDAPAPAVSVAVSASPAVVEAVAGVPAPTVSAGSSVTAAPAAVTATVSAPAPSVSAGTSATASPSAVSALAQVPTPAVSSSASAAPATVTAAASVPVPSISTGSSATAAPSVATASTSVPAPAISAGAGVNVAPAVVTATTNVPAPSVAVDASAAADAVVAVAGVPSPTVTAGGSATASPSTVDGLVDVPAPAVSAGTSANITPAAIIATTSVPTPAVSAGVSATIAASVASAVADVPTPTVVAGSDVAAAPDVITALVDALTPVVASAAVAGASTVTAVVEVFAPSISATSSAAVTPAVVTAVAEVLTPTVVALTFSGRILAASSIIPTMVAVSLQPTSGAISAVSLTTTREPQELTR